MGALQTHYRERGVEAMSILYVCGEPERHAERYYVDYVTAGGEVRQELHRTHDEALNRIRELRVLEVQD